MQGLIVTQATEESTSSTFIINFIVIKNSFGTEEHLRQ